jgi:ribosomal protein L9
MMVKVGAKAGESGKIFGSVTTVKLAEALKKAG